jgi:aspartate aminotransferase
MLAPLAGFYAGDNLGIQEARIAYVLEKDSLEIAVKCLEAALKVYPGRIRSNSQTNVESAQA